ncbi:MAG: hypothetical protein GWN64_07405, partial [Candidatus Thorarchaeota archaeon]|nr:hypothetical protein [Candidatus Thorarchaeota archaeon]
MEEAAREFRAYMGLAKLEGYGPKSLMVNELRAAAEYLELMAAAARENADAFETMYIYQRKLKPADVLANFPGGFGDPFGVAGTVGEQERAKDLLWKKQRSVLEKEWMVLLNKEEGVYGRLLVAREKYQRQWKLFSRLTADTATEVRGQVLKDTQKAFSLVYRLEGELSRYIAKRAAQINKERRAADEATFQALRRGTERYIIEIVQKRHDIEMNKLKQRMAILNKLTSIERKRGLNALDTLKEELRITEERLLQDKLSISSAEKEIDAQRRLVEMLRAIEDPTEKQLQQMHEEEDRLFKLELALKDMGLAANLTFIELQELRRQLQEMQSPVEQIRAGFRRLQVQWEDQANDFEGLTVRMGTSFENNL